MVVDAGPSECTSLIAAGDRSFCSIGTMVWNSFLRSPDGGALACVRSAPGTVTALLHSCLLATHCGGPSSAQPRLIPAAVVEMAIRKHPDSPRISSSAQYEKISAISHARSPPCAVIILRKCIVTAF